jgi:membrane-bound ClpP family serine protease
LVAVEAFLDAPAVVYLSLALGAALVLVEVALPTFGVAGLLGLGLLLAGVWELGRQDLPWWPLLLALVGVGWWAAMLVARATSRAHQAAAAAFFAVGSVVFAALAADVVTVFVAVGVSLAVPAVFPALFAATQRLLGRQPEVGMEAFVGRHAVVRRWTTTSGTVELDGSLWNADGPRGLEAGDQVVVTGYSGMRFSVRPSPDQVDVTQRPSE